MMKLTLLVQWFKLALFKISRYWVIYDEMMDIMHMYIYISVPMGKIINFFFTKEFRALRTHMLNVLLLFRA